MNSLDYKTKFRFGESLPLVPRNKNFYSSTGHISMHRRISNFAIFHINGYIIKGRICYLLRTEHHCSLYIEANKHDHVKLFKLFCITTEMNPPILFSSGAPSNKTGNLLSSTYVIAEQGHTLLIKNAHMALNSNATGCNNANRIIHST